MATFWEIAAHSVDHMFSLYFVSNEYPQSMFQGKKKEKSVYPGKPQFYYIKVGSKGVYITQTCYHDLVPYENYLICILMNINENLQNEGKSIG